MIGLLFAIVVLGAILYLIDAFIPMAPPFKILVRVVVVLIIIVLLLRLAGVLAPGAL